VTLQNLHFPLDQVDQQQQLNLFLRLITNLHFPLVPVVHPQHLPLYLYLQLQLITSHHSLLEQVAHPLLL
jgi:hypothetical protein